MDLSYISRCPSNCGLSGNGPRFSTKHDRGERQIIIFSFLCGGPQINLASSFWHVLNVLLRRGKISLSKSQIKKKIKFFKGWLIVAVLRNGNIFVRILIWLFMKSDPDTALYKFLPHLFTRDFFANHGFKILLKNKKTKINVLQRSHVSQHQKYLLI
jgi:hypothetical protein